MRRRTFLYLPAAVTGQSSKLAADHQRPKFHLLPPANWMNDPNGPIYWRGKYHIFYQYNPNGPYWGTMHWGHAVSPDMVFWKHLPIAMTPTPGGADKDGVFSGSCVVHEGVPTFVYTGTKPEVQCIATGRDDLIQWRKRAQPVLAGPPEGLNVTGFRDPCLWRENDEWRMALGSGFAGVGGAVLLYGSKDLIDWKYLGRLFEGKMDPRMISKNPVATGEMWECPSFFQLSDKQLGDKHVLFVSTQAGTPYWIGRYADGKFVPEQEGRIDWSPRYYAPITQADESGNRIVWGWVREARDAAAQKEAGWSGVMSLPRVLSMGPDGRLQTRFAPQLRKLRERRHHFVNLWLSPAMPQRLAGIQGDALEVIADIEPQDSHECGIQLLVADDGTESTPVTYHRAQNRLSIRSPRVSQNGNLLLGVNETLRLHVFLDCSVIEAIGNNRTALTERSYAKADSLGLALFARGGSAKIRSLTVHELKSISNDRMTS